MSAASFRRISGRSSQSLLVAAICSLSAIGLAGCGGGGSSSSSSASVASSSSSTQASTSASPSTSASTSATSTSSATSSASSTTSPSTSTSSSSTATASKQQKAVPGTVQFESSAFVRGGQIPTRYTCDGANGSPPLQWQKVPAGTAQLFLVALDLEGGAKESILWSIGGIDPSTHSIAAGSIPAGAVAGRTSSGKVGWGGICPAKGKAHSIVFVLYALKHKLNLSSGFQASAVQSQLKGDTAAAGLTYGVYQRN